MAVVVRTGEIIKELKNDTRVKRLAKTFAETPLFQLDIEKLTSEISDTHKLRAIRRLDSRERKFLAKVINSNTMDQRTRSRFAEIIVECNRAVSKLDELLGFLSEYLLVTYAMDLRAFRTKEERMYVIHSVLRTYRRYKRSLEVLREEARLIVEDIDKGGWSLDRSIRALQIHVHKEHILG